MIPIRFLLLLALLAGARASGPPVPTLPPPQAATPLCRVEAHVTPVALGRRLHIALRPGCPPGGVAYVRLASRLGGSLPGDPPAFYVIRKGQVLRYTALPWWWLEWRDHSGRLWRVPERETP